MQYINHGQEAYTCRYTPACEEFVCDISREAEAYITKKLPNISRYIYIADIHMYTPIGHGLYVICYVEYQSGVHTCIYIYYTKI